MSRDSGTIHTSKHPALAFLHCPKGKRHRGSAGPGHQRHLQTHKDPLPISPDPRDPVCPPALSWAASLIHSRWYLQPPQGRSRQSAWGCLLSQGRLGFSAWPLANGSERTERQGLCFLASGYCPYPGLRVPGEPPRQGELPVS